MTPHHTSPSKDGELVRDRAPTLLSRQSDAASIFQKRFVERVERESGRERISLFTLDSNARGDEAGVRWLPISVSSDNRAFEREPSSRRNSADAKIA